MPILFLYSESYNYSCTISKKLCRITGFYEMWGNTETQTKSLCYKRELYYQKWYYILDTTAILDTLI